MQSKFVCAGILSFALTASGVALAQSSTQDHAAAKHQDSKITDQNADKKPQGDVSTPSKAAVNTPDKTFLMKAAQGGIAEVKLGQMAQEKASDPQVKEFAKRMVDDHSKANDELKSVAEKQNVPLPTEPNAAEKAESNRLAKLSGSVFDRAYMRHMVQDHTRDVAEFQKEANTAKDDDVKQFAGQTLPTLQDHLKQAKEVNQKVSTGKQSKSQNPSE